jgi:2-polyprenyl-3-methyl-5-hydroxy-6-metoxy-1,4-benzoquinol methylase
MTESLWSLDEVTARLVADVPVIAGGLLAHTSEIDDPRRRWAERALEHVRVLCDGDPARLEAAMESFAITSLDFLRLQARFLKTGRYACGSADDLVGLYADSEQMVEYLDGLALSYAMWPNHAVTMAFFAQEFVDSLGPDPRVMEIGPGHGLFASLLFERRPGAFYRAIDISASSLLYTERSLRALGLPEDRYELVESDITAAPRQLPAAQFDVVVCSEVLEHVDEPELILGAIRTALAPSGTAFLTTVANMEAIDHVYLFEDVAEIRSLIENCGLSIVDERASVLAGAQEQERLPVNYSAIVER